MLEFNITHAMTSAVGLALKLQYCVSAIHTHLSGRPVQVMPSNFDNFATKIVPVGSCFARPHQPSQGELNVDVMQHIPCIQTGPGNPGLSGRTDTSRPRDVQ